MKYFITLLLILVYVEVQACDYCNYYLGLDPGYNKNTISLRSNYRFASMQITGTPVLKTMHGSHTGENEGESQLLEGSFFGMELFAKFFPMPKLMAVVNLPYQYNTLTFGDDEESRGAFSDLTVMGFYQLANTMTPDSLKVRHRLFGGIGIKFPTGKSSGASEVPIPMAHELYSGTGSTDYLAAISYIGKFNKLGWNLDLNFKYNTESKNDYQYGHTFNVTPRVFYETKIKSLTLLPHIGAAYELGMHDYFEGEELDLTGGYIFWGSAGLDFYFSRFSFTTDVRLPMTQHMHGEELEDKYWLFGSFNIHF